MILDTTEKESMYDSLWKLKASNEWFKYKIHATTTRDITMFHHDPNAPFRYDTPNPYIESICPKGTRVRVWMVSRFGDVGVTDNIENPIGYNVRGLDADKDLTNYEIVKLY
jgi:hypothetical protein